MANKYLARGDAPFESDVWNVLDGAMTQAAKSQLVGRRLLDVDGPFGVGVKAVPLTDQEQEDGLVTSAILPLHWVQKPFEMGVRDLAAYERDGLSLSVKPVAEAAIACAQAEDELVFHGTAGKPGLLTVEGAGEQALSAWDETGAAADDVIQAMTTLDEGGFHGPYALALAPKRYNLLFRRYAQGNQTEMAHVQTMATDGIFKAPVLDDGGVLVATGRQYASIVLGQDMSIVFIGPAGSKIEFAVTESLALRIRRPQAICVLT